MADELLPPPNPGDARVRALLREITASDTSLLAPPAEVWSRIEAEATAVDRTDSVDDEAGAAIASLANRPRIRRRVAILAAAAATVVIAGAMAVLLREGNDSSVVASAVLDYDPTSFDVLGVNASAHASLVEDGDRLSVDLAGSKLPRPTGESADLEVWLIRPDADGNPSQLVSLGVVDPDQPGTYNVPPSYDPGVFSVVDISVEPRDGVATHSGRSILRGTLTDT